MIDDDDDDERAPAYVTVRPYSLESAGREEDRTRRPRVFKPTMPTDRRPVQHVQFSSAPSTRSSVEALLQDAWRGQETENRGGPTVQRKSETPARFRGMSLSELGLAGNQSVGYSSGVGASSSSSAMPLPQRTKQMQEGRSLELMDLAFTPSTKIVNGQVKTILAPISLPYYNIKEDADDDEAAQPATTEQTPSGPGSKTKKKSRPTKMGFVDEASFTAGAFFVDQDNTLIENKQFLLQLPAVLPELRNPEEDVKREQEDAASAGAGATITRYPDGLLGKLRIHRSGRVRMEIGGLPFCVDQGCDTFFQQDLACVCPLAGECIDLGPINQRMVLTPDIDTMLGIDASGEPVAAPPTTSAADTSTADRARGAGSAADVPTARSGRGKGRSSRKSSGGGAVGTAKT
eukprot:gnl/TRDRNA2_/TRDRNA2_93308_c0_seq1.p1 gnl/TRDRNA2_/TRDRNA2_93308_c0~~gnl/TRDRNA2_/TRDRNA2_93308_c0_seq1.p1  ORF type:complete len:404 (+),score=70.84 gnl/TRDRNA2_/TRDRNA2_93308_c0_seq1:50-1261(+)